jgi:hypothetical protein
MVGDTTGEASERHINDKGGLEKHHPSENCRARFTESCASFLIPMSLSIGRRGQLCGMILCYSSGLDELHFAKCIHPGSVDEIKKQADPAVVRTLKAKLGSYTVLRTIALDTPEVANPRVDDKTENDLRDTSLLNWQRVG